MAAGKNYICSQLEREGWAAVDADQLVHTAISQLTPQILNAFEQPAANAGLNIKNADGSINRRELGRLLFSRPDLLSVQEALVYPEVTRLTKQFLATHEKSIINATVLYKTPELLELCQKIIFVTAPLFTRIRRARRRDKLSYRQIFRRFKAQKNLLKEYQKSGIPIEIICNR
ncbi:MAG: dephospho-CoA kinase [Treponema sp.]|nr:dephospho-CoA kinase [Treponema sp.]